MGEKVMEWKFNVILLWLFVGLASGQGPDRVRLSDVQSLTLRAGHYTTGRRSSPVPQIVCVGGTAKGAFEPKVVQCYNRGSDGYDAQWECKTDMSNDYRFGQISVTCEGFDYPEDPYVLRGSCGLEYTLDYTEEGESRHRRSANDHGYGWKSDYTSHGHHDHKKSSWFSFDVGTIFVWCFIAFVVYILYTSCVSGANQTDGDGVRRGQGGGGPGPGGYPGGGGPPPPGFRPDYHEPPPSYDDCQGSADTCQGSATGGGTRYRGFQGRTPTAPPFPGTQQGGTGAGFWTGLGLGGLGGYLFGNNRPWGNYGGYQRRQYGFGAPSHGYTRPGPSGSGSSSWFGSGGSSGSSAGTSGTRTASGFGGTTRR